MSRIDWARIAVPAFYLLLCGIAVGMAHSGLQGEHGLRALRDAGDLEKRLEADHEALAATHARIANRVWRLRTEHLDLDLLDERARAILGHIRHDDRIIR